MRSCHSILECCVTFSGVKLSIRSFVLFLVGFCKSSLTDSTLFLLGGNGAWFLSD